MSSSRRRRGRQRVDRSPSPEIGDDCNEEEEEVDISNITIERTTNSTTGSNNNDGNDNTHARDDNKDDQSDNDENDDENDRVNNINIHSNTKNDKNHKNPPIDDNTLRILISTDNHLGYAESDPIRSNDSFAAFEEILYLAKHVYSVDLVLLSGDLFHHNKPSRSTLYKTFLLLRKYTLGDNPVSIQIVSNQYENFISTVGPWNVVNYEYPYMSIDLPIFSIHGNHDDPTRDNNATTTTSTTTTTTTTTSKKTNKKGSLHNNDNHDDSHNHGTTGGNGNMLAALDLLAINNLVNYFGRQDEIDKISISPILIQKSDCTRVAIYGMGNMRDERLNRMWQGNKVRFMKPEKGMSKNSGKNGNNEDENSDESDEEENEWFNIFALHQNRDFGRGVKNCIHESMIPEWMDLVIWGHEHECNIIPTESAVGTFRITQPGSSVATSLTEGESLPKHIGILDVRGNQFRLTPVPLMQVRPFAMTSVTLADMDELDSDDVVRSETLMGEILSKEVEKLIDEARKDSRLLQVQMKNKHSGINNDEYHRNSDCDDDGVIDDYDIMLSKKLQFQIQNPEKVLVRLKVEHSGFSTLHNQRFGQHFVNQVANASEILLFHRKRSTEKLSSRKKGSKTSSNNGVPDEPTYPTELNYVNITDLVKETLDSDHKMLSILNEENMNVAIEEFITKEQKQTIADNVDGTIRQQQRKLVKRGTDYNESLSKHGDDDYDGGNKEAKVTTKNAIREICQAESQKNRDACLSIDIDDDEEKDGGTSRKSSSSSSRKIKVVSKQPTKKRGRPQKDESEDEIVDNDDVEIDSVQEESAPKGRKKNISAKATHSARSKSKGREVQVESDFDYDDDDEIVEDFSPPKKRSTAARSGGRGRRNASMNKNYSEDIIELDDDYD